MITTPEIICDLFSFLDKDQIERIQLINQFWNNVIICHKNNLPLRQFAQLNFNYEVILLCTTKPDFIYKIKFDGTNLRKENVYGYSQLTVDEILTNLNDVVFDSIRIQDYDSEGSQNDSEGNLDNILNMIKLVITKTGGRFRGRFGIYDNGSFDSKKLAEIYGNDSKLAEIYGNDSKLAEIYDNYIIVDELTLSNYYNDSFIREVCANPEIVQLPSTPKEIRLARLEFAENDEVLHFTCNGKLNGANRLTIEFETSGTNYGYFIRQWFELYRTHQNPISLVGKFKLPKKCDFGRYENVVKTFLNSTQLRVKYSFETEKLHSFFYLKRSCVLHETDSYALVIEMEYEVETVISSINASDLDQPSDVVMTGISLCVKSL